MIFVFFIFSLPMTGFFFPYSYWGISIVAGKPIHCYLVKLQRERASFVDPFWTAKLALRCADLAFIHRPNGHAIRGPPLHRFKAFLLDGLKWAGSKSRWKGTALEINLCLQLQVIKSHAFHHLHLLPLLTFNFILFSLNLPLTFNLWHLFLKKYRCSIISSRNNSSKT